MPEEAGKEATELMFRIPIDTGIESMLYCAPASLALAVIFRRMFCGLLHFLGEFTGNTWSLLVTVFSGDGPCEAFTPPSAVPLKRCCRALRRPWLLGLGRSTDGTDMART